MAEKETLRNEVDLEIPYVNDDGKNGLKRVHVKFISQAIYAEYTALVESVVEATQLGEKLKRLSQDMGYEIASRRKVSISADGSVQSAKKTLREVRATLKSMSEEAEKCNARVQELVSHMNEKKLHLIKAILLKNQIDDVDLNTDSWWLSCVDKEDMMAFITDACTKDNRRIESKKKLRVTT